MKRNRKHRRDSATSEDEMPLKVIRRDSESSEDEMPLKVIRRNSESSEDEIPLKVIRRDSESSEDEIPLKVIKVSRHKSTSTMMAQLSDDDVPLNVIQSCTLHQYSMESCRHCLLIFHTKYDELIHTAKHLKVHLTRLPVYECIKCNYYCTSQQHLDSHTNTKHTQKLKKSTTTVPDIFDLIVNCKPIVRCDDSVTKFIKANITHATVNDKGSNMTSQPKIKPKYLKEISPKPKTNTNKDLETGNIVRKKPVVDILENIVKNKPFVKCDDSMNVFVKANSKTSNRKSNDRNGISSPILSLKPTKSKKMSSKDTKTSIIGSSLVSESVLNYGDRVTALLKAKPAEPNALVDKNHSKKGNITNATVSYKGNDLDSHMSSQSMTTPKNLEESSAKPQNNTNRDPETNNIVRKKHVVDILENIVNNKPFVKCDDSVNAFIKANSKANNRESNDINNQMSSPILSFKPKKCKEISSKDTTSILGSILVNDPVLHHDDRETALTKAETDELNTSIDKNKGKNNVQSTNNTESDTLESIIKKEPVIDCDSCVTDLINVSPARIGVLGSLLNSRAVVEYDGILKKILSQKVHINEKNAKHSAVVKENGVKPPEDIQIKSKPVDNLPEIFKSSVSNIKSRIVFEDDDDFEDLETQFRVPKVEYINERKKQQDQVPVLGKFTLGTRAENANDSVHYDDLMRPGLYFCKHCRKSFPNRFMSISHEMTHMRARRFRTQLCHICDRFIYGCYKNLHIHYINKHPTRNRKPNTKPNLCNTCGLRYYDLLRHNENYHYVYVAVCGVRFNDPSKRDDHDKTHTVNIHCDLVPEYLELSKDEVQESTKGTGRELKVNGDIPKIKADYSERPGVRLFCEVCALFLKDRNNIKYVCLGEQSRVGEKQICSKCGKSFFAVKIVKTLTRKKVELIRKYDYKYDNSPSNENRLKHIQQRLKFYNTLTRL